MQARITQLKAGQPPKPKCQKYVKLDDSIAKAKLDYGIAVERVFSCVFPAHPSTYDMFNADTAHYLNRLSYFVLGQC